MSGATSGPPPRDQRDGQVHREWRGWAEANGYDNEYARDLGYDDMAEAFTAGWEAAGATVTPTASWQHAIRALAGIRDSYGTGTMAHDTAHTALDRLAGLYPHGEQPAPELGQAAHARWLQARWPDMSAARIAKDWSLLSGTAKEAWSVAGAPPELAEVQAERDKAYRERAQLVAFLAACYPSVIGPAPDAEGWAIVFADTPAGQMSWHVAQADIGLFGHLRIGSAEWDGHTTGQKYERLAELIPHALDIRHERVDRDQLRALLDCETRLRWDTGLERDRITAVREQAGLEELT